MLIVIWTVISISGTVDPALLPPPSVVASTFYDLARTGDLIVNISVSVERVIGGFLLGAVMALPLGIAMGWQKKVGAFFYPLIELMRPIPPLAFIPLAILWFGIGETSKIFVIWLGTFFPILINTITGVRNVEPILIRAARTLGANDRQIFRKVVLQSACPYILAGFRIGMANGWTCVVAAELIASASGLGYMIEDATRFFRIDIVIVGILIISAIGISLDLVLRQTEKRLTRWMEHIAE
jgi:ABC-type nitrate/sulfonate/bicarbonate transport system permease component